MSLPTTPAAALDDRATTRETFDGRIERVVVDDGAGSVTVRAGRAGEAVVSSRQTWDRSRPTLETDLTDGVLTVRASCPPSTTIVVGDLNQCRIDLTVVVPPRATVRAGADVASVFATGLRGAQTLRSGAGDVVVSAAALTRLDAATEAGDVRVTVPAGTYDLTARTDAGRRDVSGVRDRPGAPRVIRAVSGAGDVTVRGR